MTFDFEAAPYPGDDQDISDYMTAVYGSSVTATNPVVGDGILPGQLGPDHYIQVGPECGEYEMFISFDVVPIVEVEFDWGVELNDFYAYADEANEPFFHYDDGCASGHAGPFVFASPVTVLWFTNSGLWEIEVDNLSVVPIPEPATMGLLLLGALGVRRRRE